MENNPSEIPQIEAIRLIDSYLHNGLISIDMYDRSVTLVYSEYERLSTHVEEGINTFIHKLSTLIRIWINFERALKLGECENIGIQPDPRLKGILHERLKENASIRYYIINDMASKTTLAELIDKGPNQKVTFRNIEQNVEEEDNTIKFSNK